MKPMRCYVLLFSLLVLIPRFALADDDNKAAVASLVRNLGYGGAIHNFKNFVIRGDEKYRKAADKTFAASGKLIAQLSKSKGISPEELGALATIGKLIAQYQGHLPKVATLHKQKKTVEAIDEAVAVDDGPAIEALSLLREQHEWNKVQNLEFHIGYGTGIHNFKNFVLRADEKYRARATLGLSKVLLIVARFRSDESVTESQTESLDQIEQVVRAYEEALPKVQSLVGEGKTAIEIDQAVKVDDGPALKGLAELRD
jgi:methyl-accepting chemotaxis protein